MSFVSEVINIVNENEISNARSCLKKVVNEIQTNLRSSKQFIDENHEEFIDAVDSNDQHLDQANRLTHEVEHLLQSIEGETKKNVLAVAEDVQQYLTELDELYIGLRINKLLLQIDELFQLLKSLKDTYQFGTIRNTVNKLRELIFENEDKEIFKHIECYQNIKVRWHIEHETLLNTLQTRFDSLMQMQEKTFQNTKCITIKVSKDKETLQEILLMLFDTNFNAQRIYSFLMQNVFEPIITRPVSLDFQKTVEKTEDNSTREFKTFTLSFSTKQHTIGDSMNLRPTYQHVFRNMVNVFKCLHNLNVKLQNNKCFFQLLADRIAGQFYKLLTDECLTYAIPETIEDMGTSQLATEVKEFHGFLSAVEFNDTENNANKLIEFADKIEIIFKKRFCLNILNSAVTLMRKDLHDMAVIEESKSNGAFPRCMCSRNTFELIDLVEKVMHKANDQAGKTVDAYVLCDIQERLNQTIPMIMERYCTETISAHGKFLQTIPQQSALFHNNCLYLAWWLSKFQNEESNESVQIERCEAIINQLQDQGSKQFALQISNQRTQILEILNGFGMPFAKLFVPKKKNIFFFN